jgi:monoamine oxidase
VSRRASHDVVVIGAGLAGLHAAALLEAEGLDVLVLEAQQRVGGRIHSMRQLGANAEAGGTYIGAGYRRVIDSAARYGVPLIDVTPLLEFFREQDLVLGRQIIKQADWADHPANPFPAADRALTPWNYHRVVTMRENPLAEPGDWLAEEHAAEDISMHAWLHRRGLDDDAIRLAYGVNASFGADAHDVSALLLLFRAAFSKSQRALAPPGQIGFTAERGVQRIPEAMAGALRRGVALGQSVTAVDCGGARAQVRCADGSRIDAEHVVCTVPFGVLRRIAVDPPLTGAQARAVAELPAQPLTQVYLAVRTPFWEQDGYAPSLYTDSAAGMIAAVRAADDPQTVTHLTCWLMGPKAGEFDALASPEAGRRVIAAIEEIRPAARGQLEYIDSKSWGADAYAAGAWAYFRPGQVRAFMPAMSAPHGSMVFCGEHLARTSRGMEGAMESAQAAVDTIVRRG